MRGLCVIVWCAIAASARGAAADPDRAKALFDDGRALIEAADKLADPAAKAEKVDAACDKFAASLAAEATLGTKLNLADCRQRQGRVVDAYTLFDEAAAEAARTHDRETFANQQLAAAAQKVVRVKLRVVAPVAPGTTIQLGGREVPAAQWAETQIAAPGQIVVDARAPGRVPVHIAEDSIAGAEATFTLELAPVVAPAGPARSKLPYLVIGGGGALTLTSFALGLHARSRYGDAKDRGDRPGVSSAQREADIGTAFLAGGAVALGVGVWLYIRERHRDAPAVTASASAEGVSFAITGGF